MAARYRQRDAERQAEGHGDGQRHDEPRRASSPAARVEVRVPVPGEHASTSQSVRQNLEGDASPGRSRRGGNAKNLFVLLQAIFRRIWGKRRSFALITSQL